MTSNVGYISPDYLISMHWSLRFGCILMQVFKSLFKWHPISMS